MKLLFQGRRVLIFIVSVPIMFISIATHCAGRASLPASKACKRVALPPDATIGAAATP